MAQKNTRTLDLSGLTKQEHVLASIKVENLCVKASSPSPSRCLASRTRVSSPLISSLEIRLLILLVEKVFSLIYSWVGNGSWEKSKLGSNTPLCF